MMDEALNREMLIRIDERTSFISKELEVNSIEIDNLKCFKNKMLGAMVIIGSLTGYEMFF